MRNLKIIGTWLLQVLLGGVFVLVGVMKFRDPTWVRMFARWGYPDGFYMVVGVLEAIGGVAVLIPRLASYGAVLIMVVMAGAALTHLTHGETQRFMAPVMYLMLAAVVGWLRRKSAFARRPAVATPAARGDITVAS